VAFSPDSQLLASATYDNIVRLWDTKTGVSRGTFEDDSHWIEAVAFSSDGLLLASASYDKTVRLWDIVTKEVIQKLNTDAVIRNLSFTSDGSNLETNRGILELIPPTFCEPRWQSNSQSPLYVGHHWVTWRRNNILCLPPDYRGSWAAIRHNILVIVHKSGRVTFTEFEPDSIILMSRSD
jgi:WD40 repeat protein